MDVKAYIESGILEAYAIGAASEQELQEVQCMAKVYPEIREALTAIEEAMESYASEAAIPPPASLKEAILKHLDDQPAQAEKPKVIPLNPEPRVVETKPTNVWMWAAAASVILLVASYLGYLQDNANNERLREEIAALSTKIEENNEQYEALAAQLEYREDQLAFIGNPATMEVRMPGVETKSPESLVTVFWNESSNKVMMAVNNLPEPPIGKQYQLWAIADGQPVDLGVFDWQRGFELKQMKSAESAQAFAITLENEGGSPTPTLDEMYVMGGV